MMKSKLHVATLLVGLLAVAGTAQQTAFVFKLSGAQENPPVVTAATGLAVACLDTATNQLSVVVHHNVGQVTAAHIHMAPAGMNGGIVFPFSSPATPITQTFTLSAPQVATLMAGGFYVNVHSGSHPGGEIRGQIVNGGPAGVIINEYCNDPFGVVGLDTNNDGTAASSPAQQDDEFVEIVNASCGTVDISNWTVSDAVGVRHTFASGTMLPPLGAIVVFGGGSVASFAGSGVVASTGQLGLNNTADTITIADASAGVVDTYTYTSGGPDDGDGESITRNPDGPAGAFVMHTTVGAGATFSAGTTTDGCAFRPAIMGPPAALFCNGNGADVGIQIRVNGVVDNTANNRHSIVPGDVVSIQFDSPMGGLMSNPFIAIAQTFITGFAPAPIQLPGDPAGSVCINPLPGPATIILADGLSNTAQILNPVLGFYQIVGSIPAFLGGSNLSLTIACLATAPGFNPVNLGVAPGHALDIQ